MTGQLTATVVVCVVDGETIEAMVPTSQIVNLDRLLELAGGRVARLAQQDEAAEAEARRVFVDVSLAGESLIVFQRSSDEGASVIRWSEFARTVRPIVGRFAERGRDCVPLYRLSSRE